MSHWDWSLLLRIKECDVTVGEGKKNQSCDFWNGTLSVFHNSLTPENKVVISTWSVTAVSGSALHRK